MAKPFLNQSHVLSVLSSNSAYLNGDVSVAVDIEQWMIGKYESFTLIMFPGNPEVAREVLTIVARRYADPTIDPVVVRRGGGNEGIDLGTDAFVLDVDPSAYLQRIVGPTWQSSGYEDPEDETIEARVAYTSDRLTPDYAEFLIRFEITIPGDSWDSADFHTAIVVLGNNPRGSLDVDTSEHVGITQSQVFLEDLMREPLWSID
jgi:hypothetical protein